MVSGAVPLPGSGPSGGRRGARRGWFPAISSVGPALFGDGHTHPDRPEGSSPANEMAQAARALGHEWIALTDHAPRLTVAHGPRAAVR
jgi:hypothetical protein